MYKLVFYICVSLALVLAASVCVAVVNPPICPHVLGWNSTINTWAQGAPWIKVIFSGDIAPAKAIGSKVFYRPWDADSANHDDGCLPSSLTGSQYADLVWAKISGMASKPDAVGYRNEFNWVDAACSKRTCQEFVNYASRLRTLGYTGKIIFGSFGVGWVDDAIWNDPDLTAAVNASDGVETHEYFDFEVSCGAPWLAFRHRDIAIANHAYLQTKDWYIGEFGSDRVCNGSLPCADPLCRRGWRDNNKLTEQAYITQLGAYRSGCSSKVVAVFVFQQGDSGPWLDFEVLGTNVAEWMRSTWGLGSGRFSGRVYDSSGAYIPGATVVVTPGLYTRTATSMGYYATVSIPAGTTYNVTASKPGYGSQTVTRLLNAGPDTIVNFSLPPIASIPQAKKQASGTAVVSGVVTARFPVLGAPERIYIEDSSRQGGIAVLPAGTAFPADLVQAQGAVFTTADGERVLKDATIQPIATAQSLPKPYATSNLWLGGGQFGQQPALLNTGATDTYSVALSNVGLLCHAWGSVTYVDPGGAFFYLDDGSNLSDGSTRPGLRVATSSLPVPASGAKVDVIGISSTTTVNSKIARLLRPRCVSDLSYATGSNHAINPGFEVGSLPNWTTYGRVDGMQSGTWFGGVTARSGSWFVGSACNWDAKTGGLYQRVITRPGRQYQAKVWSRIFWSGSYAASAQSRVGIDPNGGTDPAAASVLWSIWDMQGTPDYSTWVQLTTPTITAGDIATIFLDFKQTDAAGWHVNCFDDAGVYQTP